MTFQMCTQLTLIAPELPHLASIGRNTAHPNTLNYQVKRTAYSKCVFRGCHIWALGGSDWSQKGQIMGIFMSDF